MIVALYIAGGVLLVVGGVNPWTFLAAVGCFTEAGMLTAARAPAAPAPIPDRDTDLRLVYPAKRL